LLPLVRSAVVSMMSSYRWPWECVSDYWVRLLQKTIPHTYADIDDINDNRLNGNKVIRNDCKVMAVDPELISEKGPRIDDSDLVLFPFFDNALVESCISSAARVIRWIAVVDTLTSKKSSLGNWSSMLYLTNPIQAEDVFMVPVGQKPGFKLLVVISA
jgi:hypothetical protein